MKPDGQTPQDSEGYVDTEEEGGAGSLAWLAGSSDTQTARSPDPASDVPPSWRAPGSLLRRAPPKPPRPANQPSDAQAASLGYATAGGRPFLHDPRLWPTELLREPHAAGGLATGRVNHGALSVSLPRVPGHTPDPDSSQYLPVHLGSEEDLQDEATRLYSPNYLDRLLLDADCEAGSLRHRLADEPPEDDETRHYVHPAFALGAPNPWDALEDADADDDEMTRAYCAPLPSEPEVLGPLERPTTEPWLLSSVPTPARSKKRYVVMTLLATVAAGLWLIGSLQQKTLNGPQVMEARANESPSAIQEPAQTRPLANVWISVEPVDAELTLDGMPVSNPLTLQRRPDDLEHELVARAPGYEVLTRRVRLDRDVLVILGLSPSPSASSSKERSRVIGVDRGRAQAISVRRGARQATGLPEAERRVLASTR